MREVQDYSYANISMDDALAVDFQDRHDHAACNRLQRPAEIEASTASRSWAHIAGFKLNEKNAKQVPKYGGTKILNAKSGSSSCWDSREILRNLLQSFLKEPIPY